MIKSRRNQRLPLDDSARTELPLGLFRWVVRRLNQFIEMHSIVSVTPHGMIVQCGPRCQWVPTQDPSFRSNPKL